LFEDALFTFAPYCSLFRSACGYIDTVDSIDKYSAEEFSAMGNGIGFEKSWA
jgi:hypothetical protein